MKNNAIYLMMLVSMCVVTLLVVNQYLNHPVLVIDDLNREFSGYDGERDVLKIYRFLSNPST